MRLGELPGLLAELAAPPACAVCGADCRSGAILCVRCERALARGSGRRLWIDGIDSAWAARPYEGVVRDLIGAIKFGRLVPAVRRAAELIADEVPAELLEGQLVPVPADPVRCALRGFDPAHSLARGLAESTDRRLLECLRRPHGRRQVGRSRAERLDTPPRVSALWPLPTLPLVLVDDVSTTGATLATSAAALRRGGCVDIRAVVLAAAPA
jgi:predicted amidophosphoribosyltransferase